MKRKHLLLALALFLLASVPVQLFAQCGAVAKPVAYPLLRSFSDARFHLALQDARSEHDSDLIVGLWKMDFEDPAHNYSDKGYSVWHSDHTEFLNSTRAPSVGAVCQGVWERVGEYSYRLNHFALGYDDGVHLTGVYHFKELVTIDRSGDRFTGTFSIERYDPQTHISQGTFKGTLTGERIKIDTGIDSQNF